MAAIAQVEGGFNLAPVREVHEDDPVPVAGLLELRHGRFDSLTRGAELMHLPVEDLVRYLDKGTEAGALVLDELALTMNVDRSDLSSWAPVVEELSGLAEEADRAAYRAQVYRLLRSGGVVNGTSGEEITIAPHPEIDAALTTSPVKQTLTAAQFPGAIVFNTPQCVSGGCKYTPGRAGTPITMIAIHDTEGGWNASVATLQNDPGKSVHYIVDADGSRVGQFVSEGDTAYHAGNFYYNQHMVGIEHVGVASSNSYQTAMYKKSAALVNNIASRNHLGPNGNGTGLTRSQLVGHQEVPDGGTISESSAPCGSSPSSCISSNSYGGSSNHRDPGIYWEWCRYAHYIGNGAQCKCNDVSSTYTCAHDNSAMVRCSGGSVQYVDCPSGCVSGSGGASCTGGGTSTDNCAGKGDGYYCGGDLIPGDPKTLYHCVGGATATATACANGCEWMPSGTPDKCNATGNICSGHGDGLYCGGDGVTGDTSTLYQCGGGGVAKATYCAKGCQYNPSGTPDACK